MATLRAWFARLRGLAGRRRADDELAAEMDTHLRAHIDDNLRAGMSYEAARRDALTKFGGISPRSASGEPWAHPRPHSCAPSSATG